MIVEATLIATFCLQQLVRKLSMIVTIMKSHRVVELYGCMTTTYVDDWETVTAGNVEPRRSPFDLLYDSIRSLNSLKSLNDNRRSKISPEISSDIKIGAEECQKKDDNKSVRKQSPFLSSS